MGELLKPVETNILRKNLRSKNRSLLKKLKESERKTVRKTVGPNTKKIY